LPGFFILAEIIYMNQSTISEYKKSVRHTFDTVVNGYNRHGTPFFTHFGEKLVEMADIKPGHKILDIACGKGDCTLPAVKAAGREGAVMGIDVSSKMVQFCQYEFMAIKQAQFQEMDVEAIDFPNDAFDRALCGFALFFFEDVFTALKQIDRVLKKGGFFVFSTWASQHHFNWLHEKMPQYLAHEMPKPASEITIDFTSPSELKKMVEAMGWKWHSFKEHTVPCTFENAGQWLDMWRNTGIQGFLSQLDAGQLKSFELEAQEMFKKYLQGHTYQVPFKANIIVAQKK